MDLEEKNNLITKKEKHNAIEKKTCFLYHAVWETTGLRCYRTNVFIAK